MPSWLAALPSSRSVLPPNRDEGEEGSRRGRPPRYPRAVDEGIVPGGGVAYIRALSALEGVALPAEQQFGITLIRRALEEPIRQIAQNAGVDGSIVVDKVKNGKGAFGFNAADDEYVDMIAAGIIDPTKVSRSALQNAASVAGLMLTTEAMIADKPKEEGAMPQCPAAWAAWVAWAA